MENLEYIKTKEYVTSLSEQAIANINTISDEASRRRLIGLAGQAIENPKAQVQDYLEKLYKTDPAIDAITAYLVKDKKWRKPPSMITTIPVVGTGQQEEGAITRTIQYLSKDSLVQSGDIAILLLVNRPLGRTPDKTLQIAENLIQYLGLNGIVLDIDIPNDVGNTRGPFEYEMATQPNDVPIGLLRDLLSISAMKLWRKNSYQDIIPIILQMDGDFEGFARGSLEQILQAFADPELQFLQCTSDWDSSEYPTRADPGLWIGSELMRELPQILKTALNRTSIPMASRTQIIFGEAIQRGIQVPQAERAESIAKKGGYGLSRIKEDELDQNIRMSECINPFGVRTTKEVVFVWSNRRAVASWQTVKQPPISQWISNFSVEDPVRSLSAYQSNSFDKSDIMLAINRTLERFPVPAELKGVYSDFKEPILQLLSRYEIDCRKISVCSKTSKLSYIQIE